jgi:Glycosyltransferase family 87
MEVSTIPAMRAGHGHFLRKAVAPLLLVLIVSTFICRIAVPAAGTLSHGFLSYYVAAQTIRSGEPATRLYDDRWFAERVMRASNGKITDIYLANPPTLAVAWLPFSYLPVTTARKVWIAISIACLAISFWLIAMELSWSRNWWALVGMSAVFLLGAPTREQIYFGQMYALLLLLHVIAWRSYVRHRDPAIGVALGLAMALKFSGWPIGLLLLVQRRWSAVLWAGATAGAAALVALPWVGADVWRLLLLEVIPQALGRPAATLTAYQDTTGFWQHLFRYVASLNPNPVLNAPALATFLTMATTVGACYALLRSRRAPGITFAAAVALTELLSPAAEQYHYVVLLLPLTVLWHEAWSRRNRTLGLVALAATILVTGPIDYKSSHAAWDILQNYPRLIGGWIVFTALLVPRRTATRVQDSVDDSSPARTAGAVGS